MSMVRKPLSTMPEGTAFTVSNGGGIYIRGEYNTDSKSYSCTPQSGFHFSMMKTPVDIHEDFEVYFEDGA